MVDVLKIEEANAASRTKLMKHRKAPPERGFYPYPELLDYWGTETVSVTIPIFSAPEFRIRSIVVMTSP